ncbi:alpha/beta fold hydrolase [Pseudomonas sp. ANT_H12B]|uniref:alpha/beta fold hydrolase n=1 Tax=Pseudomonas sp. ANT_H12B TaxID=2597348 RepID=UPI0011EE5AB7|nr:alpha/beta fold hydrolase [Pseudomonas sp. ANT_H12B]KAA0972896.1 alpha/beta fold hydrolase [Pseudomonas sp. ANT_H12B]
MSSTALTRGYYPTCDGHQLYWERHGTAGAEPVFFLHGGPGGRSHRHHLEFFDLRRFDVIFFDQRGCGRSMPQNDLCGNTTGLSVEDIDALRQHFGFAKISLLGVSWGSWLAIQYQQRYREALLKTTLVSVFVPFPANVSAYEQSLNDGLSTAADGSAGNRVRDIYQILSEGCPLQQRHAAIQWLEALLQHTGQSIRPGFLEDFVDEEAIRAIRLELHYHLHRYYFTPADEGLTLDDNTLLIQGIRDVFGMSSVRWLRQRMSIRCRLLHAGHNAFDPATLKAVRQALMRDIEH